MNGPSGTTPSSYLFSTHVPVLTNVSCTGVYSNMLHLLASSCKSSVFSPLHRHHDDDELMTLMSTSVLSARLKTVRLKFWILKTRFFPFSQISQDKMPHVGFLAFQIINSVYEKPLRRAKLLPFHQAQWTGVVIWAITKFPRIKNRNNGSSSAWNNQNLLCPFVWKKFGNDFLTCFNTL